MKSLLRSLAVLAALALIVPGAASAKNKTNRSACYKQTPSVLQFSRNPGDPKGMLNWRQPRKKVRIRHGYTYRQFKAYAFRVYRNGAVVGQTRKTWMPVAVKPGQSPILPVMVGDAALAVKLADALLARGIYVIAFSYPVVPQGQARIRIQVSAAHTTEQIDRTAAAFAEAGEELGIIGK